MGTSNTTPSVPQLPSDEVIRDLLAVQKQDLALRYEEIKRETAQLEATRSVAKQTIEAQERDRRHSREQGTRRDVHRLVFSFMVLMLVIGFSVYAIQAGQTTLVFDLVKVFIGFAAGMGYQAYKNSRSSAKDEHKE